MAVKNFSLRIDENLLDKLHVVSDYEGRSANGQVLYLIRKAVEQYESRHGKITLDEPKKSADNK